MPASTTACTTAPPRQSARAWVNRLASWQWRSTRSRSIRTSKRGAPALEETSGSNPDKSVSQVLLAESGPNLEVKRDAPRSGFVRSPELFGASSLARAVAARPLPPRHVGLGSAPVICSPPGRSVTANGGKTGSEGSAMPQPSVARAGCRHRDGVWPARPSPTATGLGWLRLSRRPAAPLRLQNPARRHGCRHCAPRLHVRAQARV